MIFLDIHELRFRAAELGTTHEHILTLAGLSHLGRLLNYGQSVKLEGREQDALATAFKILEGKRK